VFDLYGGDFHITTATAPRFLNCRGDRRGPVQETIITSYRIDAA
jgi:hypothetical protein